MKILLAGATGFIGGGWRCACARPGTSSSASFARRAAPIALFEACADAGVKRIVQLSALGADALAPTLYLLSDGRQAGMTTPGDRCRRARC